MFICYILDISLLNLLTAHAEKQLRIISQYHSMFAVSYFLTTCLLRASNYKVFSFLLTEPKYIPWLWCSWLHTCWKLAYQTRFWNHRCGSRFRCYQGHRFLLWRSHLRCMPHWTLPCYSWSAKWPVNQSASSTCYDPVWWRGIARQRSVSTESWPACRGQWSWSVGRSSCQDKSWRRVCSSRSVTWSLVCQTQSPLQEGCIHFDRSSMPSYNERCSGKE